MPPKKGSHQGSRECTEGTVIETLEESSDKMRKQMHLSHLMKEILAEPWSYKS